MIPAYMVAFAAKFDGTVIIPDEPLDLRANQRVLVSLEPFSGIPGSELLSFAGTISPADLAAMSQAIEEGCERVDPHDW
jgi:hypothetical protein